MTIYTNIILFCSLMAIQFFYRRRRRVNFEKKLRHLCYDRFHLQEGDKNLVDPLYEYILAHPGNKNEVSELAFAYYQNVCYNIEELDKVIRFIQTGNPTYQELLRSEIEQFYKRSQEAVPWEQTKLHRKDP